MANLDLSQTVGGAYRGLPLFADAHCTKHFGGSPGRPLGSESGVAGPAMVEEERGSEIDRGEADVIVGEIIESDLGEMGRGRGTREGERTGD